ncbi:MAG TPA: aldo/keto reductase [Solirubrobacteraceae bacterium]|nr:aldo/keto reductase [Solirubrobacteraceae bacterium]
MSETRSPTVTIADGVAMPLLGLGTWQASDREAYDAVRAALDLGYRSIDTATMYGNEDAVGRAVRDSGLAREEVFVTTKLRGGDAGRERETIRASLDAMGLDHVDLWLIHWPVARGKGPGTWQRFVETRDAGLTRSIGVSNYSAAEIDELIDATGVVPAVNQIEWTPALYDAATVGAHRDRGVTLEGYSPFKAADLRNPILAAIAEDHGVTVPQVILRWHLEHGFVAIPKSSDAGRIAENFDVFGFALDGDEVARIDSLGRR